MCSANLVVGFLMVQVLMIILVVLIAFQCYGAMANDWEESRLKKYISSIR